LLPRPGADGELAYNYSITKIGKPIITLKEFTQMQNYWPTCSSQINQCQTDTSECPTAQGNCDNAMMGPYEATGTNPYNIELPVRASSRRLAP